QRLIGGPHPYLERLAVEARLSAGDLRAAVQRGRAAVKQFGDSRALAREYGRALVAAGDGAEAVAYLRETTGLIRSDPVLWRLRAEAHGMQDQRTEAHRAAAEEFALVGAWPAAIDQLRRAQRARDADYFVLSMIDARLRELESIYRIEQEDLRRSGRSDRSGR
ncbi:MAG TPA: tetratricopeptide repeat protein, partial [Burkholderiaceae bacterium]|nr:tetratricopeptide repeat protein [Burkholderiaceae bacterium]